MLPVNIGGHTAYQNTFVSKFLKLYPDPFAVPKSTWDTIVKFWYLDLSETDTIMAPFYPLSGKPASRFLSCMLRSYLLSISLKISSITKWCELLRITPLYAILSGFHVEDTPGIGTFYDFFNRLWQSDKNNCLDQIKHKIQKPKKGKNMVIRHLVIQTALLQNCFLFSNDFPYLTQILFVWSFVCIKNSSLTTLSKKGLSILGIFPLSVTALRLKLHA